jgi:hypothetical protein
MPMGMAVFRIGAYTPTLVVHMHQIASIYQRPQLDFIDSILK